MKRKGKVDSIPKVETLILDIMKLLKTGEIRK